MAPLVTGASYCYFGHHKSDMHTSGSVHMESFAHQEGAMEVTLE